MEKYKNLTNNTKIEIEITDKDLGISSKATLNGEMIKRVSEAVSDEVLPIEEIFEEMVNQIIYDDEGLIPATAKVNFFVSDEETDLSATAQILGESINQMYSQGINGMTWCFDQIVEKNDEVNHKE